MSTYTDLHNRVKENIAVDYNNRITPQRVRFFNEQNEFWGTLRGHVSAENINIEGGTLSGVAIKNSSLEGEIILPGGVDLSKIGNSIKQISTDLTATRQDLYEETVTREKADDSLDKKIDNLDKDINKRIDDLDEEFNVQLDNLSSTLTIQDFNISTTIMKALSDEAKVRYDTDSYLSDQIDITNNDLYAEISNRIIADNKLQSYADSIDLSSRIRDKALSDALSVHIEDNYNQFNEAEQKMLSTVEHERHYVINSTGTTEIYPFEAKDYAMNVYRTNVLDAKVTYTDTYNNVFDIGKIELSSETSQTLPFIFTPYVNIQHNGIASALVGNMPYALTEEHQMVPTYSNGYKLKYDVPAGSESILSAAKLKLIPNFPKFHKVYLSGTAQMIGKMYKTLPEGESAHISSGILFIDTNDINLLTFNKFKKIHFDINDDKETKLETERVTYLEDNKFKLEKNIDVSKYIQLTDISNSDHQEFGKIYELKNGISGILSDDSGITEINATIDYPLQTVGRMSKVNGFKTTLQSSSTKDTILSAAVDGMSATIDVVYKSDLYKYAFTRPNDVGEPVEMGTLTPNVYNKFLIDKPEYNEVSVDATRITDNDKFATVWTLVKDDKTGIYAASMVDDSTGDTMEIQFNGINLYVRTVKAGEIIRRRFNVKIDDPQIANPGVTYVRFSTGKIDLSKYTSTAEQPELPIYYAEVEAAESQDQFSEYVLDIDTKDNASIKIVFPDRTTDDISREFFITVKLDCKTEKLVRADFVDKNGKPIVFFNNYKTDLYIKAGPNEDTWVTYMVNEIGHNKFLITDLNDIDDHDVLKKLRDDLNELSGKHIWLSTALSTDIQKLSADLSSDIEKLSADLSTEILSIHNDLYVNEDFLGNKGLSGKVDFLLSVDRDSTNYKGVLPYLSNYTSPGGEVEDYALLSEFIGQCKTLVIPGQLLKGDLFKLSAAQSCLVDTSAASVYLGENDFFIVNKECKVSDILTSDIDIFRDFESEVEEVRRALCAEIQNLSTSLSDTTRLSVEELQSQIISNDNDIEFLSTDINRLCDEISASIDSLSTRLSNDIDDLSTSLSDTTRLSVEELQRQIISNDNDIEYLSNTLSLEIQRNIDHLAYFGEVKLSTEYDVPEKTGTAYNHLFGLIYTNLSINGNPHKRVVKGTLFKAIGDELSIYNTTDTVSSIDLHDNDFIMLNKTVPEISGITVADVEVIKDYDLSVKLLKQYTDDLVDLSVTHLVSGDITYVGKNTFTNETKFDNNVSVANVLTASVELERVDIAANAYVDGRISSNASITAAGTVNVEKVPGIVGSNLTASYGNSNLKLQSESITATIEYPNRSGTMALFSDVKDLSDSISGTVKLSTESLQEQISANDIDISSLSNEISCNDNDISSISADLLSVETRYYSTFVEKDKSDNDHISSDNLILTDVDEHIGVTEHKRYYMTFENGTIVLKPLR